MSNRKEWAFHKASPGQLTCIRMEFVQEMFPMGCAIPREEVQEGKLIYKFEFNFTFGGKYCFLNFTLIS